METLVKIQNLHKVYFRGSERIDVLEGVTLDIPQGDFLALMGPSGSGKTTLLNLMGGLDAPSEGSIEVAGDRIDKMSGGRLAAWRTVPPYALAAGALGVLFISAISYTIPRIGVATSVALLLTAQLSLAALLDHQGWLGTAVRSFDASRMAGLVLLLVGSWLVLR